MTALVSAAVVWSGCAQQAQVRPASIVIACADGNFYVDHLRWTTWGPRSAVGKGIAQRNDCTPNCAAGHFHSSAMTVRWGAASADSETLPCSFLRLKP